MVTNWRYYAVILLFISVLAQGQLLTLGTVSSSKSVASADTTFPAWSLSLDNNLTDDIGTYSWAGNLAYDNADPKEGTHFGDFNASSRTIDTDGNVAIDDTFFISGWARTGSSSYVTVASSWDGSYGWMFQVQNNGASDNVLLRTWGPGGGSQDASGSGSFLTTAWFHYVMSIDKSNGYGRIWIDGTKVTTDSTIRTDVHIDDKIVYSSFNSGGWLYGDQDLLQGGFWLPTEVEVDSAYNNASRGLLRITE